jgi:hypothetical protein
MSGDDGDGAMASVAACTSGEAWVGTGHPRLVDSPC